MRASRRTVGRRQVALALAGATCLLRLPGNAVAWATANGADTVPALQRIKAATLSTPAAAAAEAMYRDGLDHVVRERGVIGSELARSWGAPAAAGRRYALLSPDSAPDVFLRIIESPQAVSPPPLTTFGWSAIELIVDDPDQLRDELRGSGFRVIGEPAPLATIPSIRAFQLVGADGEVLYLASETGDRSKSILPLPNGRVGRIFIMVAAATDPRVTLDWYARSFALSPGPLRTRPNRLLETAQGLPVDTPLPIATMRLAQHGNLVQIDGYAGSAVPRRLLPGDLPPAVTMTTFGVSSLGDLTLDWISTPAPRPGLLYRNALAATVRGPDGELIELVEEPPGS